MPVVMAVHDSTAPVAEKAQHAPQEPWDFTGVTYDNPPTLLQSHVMRGDEGECVGVGEEEGE